MSADLARRLHYSGLLLDGARLFVPVGIPACTVRCLRIREDAPTTAIVAEVTCRWCLRLLERDPELGPAASQQYRRLVSGGRPRLLEIAVVFDREADGRWIGAVPALPGVLVYGSSRAEAGREAISLALRVLEAADAR